MAQRPKIGERLDVSGLRMTYFLAAAGKPPLHAGRYTEGSTTDIRAGITAHTAVPVAGEVIAPGYWPCTGNYTGDQRSPWTMPSWDAMRALGAPDLIDYDPSARAIVVRSRNATAEQRAKLPPAVRYLSGNLSTRYQFGQEFGVFLARMTLTATPGAFPAFWLYREDSTYPEIDFMEQLGTRGDAPGRRITEFYATVHSRVRRPPPQTLVRGLPDLSSRPFWYGGIWTAEDVAMVFGESLETLRYVAAFECPPDIRGRMFLQAGLAMGGSWPGPAPEHVDTAILLHDMRAYELPA